MSQHHDYVALDWVRGEIEETLQQAQKALEAFVENPSDRSRLQFCQNYIHQVVGTLQMVEFYGAALLAEEMEKLLSDLLADKVSNTNDAHQVLMQGILQLPGYLDHVKMGHRDLPVVLLPLLNELRSAHGEKLLTESALFDPKLVVNYPELTEAQIAKLDSANFVGAIKKIRKMYQMAYLGLSKNQDVVANLQYLGKIFVRLVKVSQGAPVTPLWITGAAIVEGVGRRSIKFNASIKSHLKNIDTVLKALAENGPTALNYFNFEKSEKQVDSDSQPQSQFEIAYNQALYGISKSKLNTGYLAKAKEIYGFSAQPDEKKTISALDQNTTDNVVSALSEEINQVKEKLDALVKGETGKDVSTPQITKDLKTIADTLAILGLGMPRSVVQEQTNILQTLPENAPADEVQSTLMDVAGALLYVEANIKGLVEQGVLNNASPSRTQLNDAQRAVVFEARNVIERVKESVVAYIAKQWDKSEVSEVKSLLENLRSSMLMVPMPRIASILESTAQYVSEVLIDQSKQPEMEELDLMANTLSGVEYYLERLQKDGKESSTKALLIVEESLQKLGYQVAEAEDFGPEAEPEMEAKEIVHSQTDETLLDEGDSLDAMVDQEVTEVVSDLATAETEQSAEFEQADAELEVAVTVDEQDEDDSLIDDEILEIFIEEAEEVLETIEEFWPQYKQDQSDQEAFVTVRRAFHTLKGSGRMVEAAEIGELAWSIENMLNRIIDKTIEINENIMALIDQVVEFIPQLINAFKTRANSGVPSENLMAYAHQIAEQKSVANFSEFFASISGESTAVDSDESEEDQGLLEVFTHEVNTHLATVEEFIRESEALNGQKSLTDQLQRALHTLKGSAHMAEQTGTANIAGELESFVKELRLYQVPSDISVLKQLTMGYQLIQNRMTQLMSGGDQNDQEVILFVEHLQNFQAELIGQFSDHVDPGRKIRDPQVINVFLSEGMDLIQEMEDLFKEWDSEANQFPAGINEAIRALGKGADIADLGEVKALADALASVFEILTKQNLAPNQGLLHLIQSSFETMLDMLDQVAAAQSISPAIDLIQQLTELVESVADVVDVEDVPVLQEVEAEQTESYAELMDQDTVEESAHLALDDLEFEEIELSLAANENGDADESIEIASLPEIELEEDSVYDQVEIESESDFESSIQQVSEPTELNQVEYAIESPQPLPVIDDESRELLDIFIDEAEETITSINETMEEWEQAPENFLKVAELQRDMHTLKGGARMAEISPIGDLGHEVETLYEKIGNAEVTADQSIVSLLHQCHDALAIMVDQLMAELMPAARPDLIAAVLQAAGIDANNPAAPTQLDIAEANASNVSKAESLADDPVVEILDDADSEILEIFLEEAQELMEALDIALNLWINDPTESRHGEELQRVLHTLKGGARLSNLTEIGDLSHNYESFLVTSQLNDREVDEAFFKEVHEQQDLLENRIAAVRKVLASKTGSVEDAPAVIQKENDSENNVVPFKGKKEATNQKQQQNQAARKGPQELVKVSSDLLDGLVNLAGETSISRGRLEQQVTDFSTTLDEMDVTLERLREQLRRLDIETEAQVLFRQEQAGPNYDDFDPLEMDRYSHMQQLSRSLVESASDLMDLRETLTEKTRDAETLLLQQSRVNTELQEGLMKTRMVPFSGLVPRLRRITRQVAGELHKQAELKVTNAEGEMDRTILERLISPLEHMLRNALDHGLEQPDEREALGKPATGSIVIDINREAGDVVIMIKDDGKGIDVQAVKAKAIERGLLPANADITDQEALQFILQAGFSTADKVTQISGRGVGMDVVHSEIKQMGGTMSIQSELGKGAQFIVRVPFTVSVNRALMVTIGGDQYAIPLNSIEGIVRVSPTRLQELYQTENATFDYAGRDYKIDYLGNLMRTGASPKLSGEVKALPLVLVRGDEPMALQVDDLRGSREIVVKTLGPQFSSVAGISGGTILGDGSVVIILDLPSLNRHIHTLEYQQHLIEEQEQEAEIQSQQAQRPTLVMVVDDSVTVRKVTTRLLERNGMEVRTAKDGVDALNQMQDFEPDLVLLDIEMPRMDGFEVASQMRHHSRLKSVPIVMITSRTGEKHRERAMAIGVNEYMGKPFQEETLLASIERHTQTETA